MRFVEGGNPLMPLCGPEYENQELDMDQNSNQIQDIFDQAADLPTDQREVFVHDACEGDRDLEQRILELLGQLPKLPTVEGEGSPDSDMVSPYSPGDRLGKYTIKKELGRGGYGLVYLASQQNPSRDVAIKLILPRHTRDSGHFIERFKREQELLVRLDHPCIASFFDSDQDEEGRPFIVMQYIDGNRLDYVCDKERLDIETRLRIAADICDAVSHAHSRGIVHRDLKPGNILLKFDEESRSWRPMVIDFGIAKATESEGSPTDMDLSVTGAQMGTFGYMSPEQFDGELDKIGTATDVYALGVVLYKLLAGRLPVEYSDLHKAAYKAKRKLICEDAPPRPGQWLATGSGKRGLNIAFERSTEVGDLSQKLSRELEYIPMRALRKEPEERYESARQMGEDIRRYLRGEQLIAGPDSAAYRLRKSIRRHKGAYLAVAAIFLVLIAGVVVSLWFANKADVQRKIALQEARLANLKLYSAQLNIAKNAWDKKRYQKFDRAISDARSAWGELSNSNATPAPFELRVLEGQRDGSISTLKLDPKPDISRPMNYFKPAGAAIGFNSEGTLVATLERGSDKINIRNVGTNELHLQLNDAKYSTAAVGRKCRPEIIFSKDGSTLVSVAQLDDGHTVGKLRVWSLFSGNSPIAVIDRVVDSGSPDLKPSQKVTDAVALSGDGSLFAYYCNLISPNNTEAGVLIRVIETSSGDLVDEIKFPTKGNWNCGRLAFGPDGSILAFTFDHRSEQSYLYLRDLQDKQPIGRIPIGSSASTNYGIGHLIAFHPDGNEIAVGQGADVVICDTDFDSVKKPQSHSVEGGFVRSLEYSNDGLLLAIGTSSGPITLYGKGQFSSSLRKKITGNLGEAELYGHTAPILDLSFSKDSSRLFSFDGSEVKTWITCDLQNKSGNSRSPRCWMISQHVPSPDGRFYAYTYHKQMGGINPLRDRNALWLARTDANGGGFTLADSYSESQFAKVAFSPDAQKIAAWNGPPARFDLDGKLVEAENNGYIRLWELQAGKELKPLELPEYIEVKNIASLDFSPDGNWLLVGHKERGLLIYGLDEDHLKTSDSVLLEGDMRGFSPDGSVLATACDDGRLLLWSVVDWSLTQTIIAHDSVRGKPIREIAWSLSGDVLVTGGWDGFIRCWDPVTGIQAWEYQVPSSLPGVTNTGGVGITSDGLRLVYGNGVIGFVDLQTGNFLVDFEPDRRPAGQSRLRTDGGNDLEFGPYVQSPYMPGDFTFWDVRPRSVVAMERSHLKKMEGELSLMVGSWIEEELDDQQILLRLDQELKVLAKEEGDILSTLVLKALVARRSGYLEISGFELPLDVIRKLNPE